ncbi:MAG TPA: hypothetical protein VMG08_08660 [Allosphingosinicella sp.]|nr:hypothetical protein [Allosphingosinicella sp.]
MISTFRQSGGSLAFVKRERIAQVCIDDRDRLLLCPAETAFDQIYRAAAGLNWDATARAMIAPLQADGTMRAGSNRCWPPRPMNMASR